MLSADVAAVPLASAGRSWFGRERALGAAGLRWITDRPALVLGVLTSALYAWAALVRFERGGAGVDLAIFNEAVRRYAAGQMPWSLVKGAGGFNLLGDHFTPLVALLAVPYRLHPDPRTLLVAQAALVGVSTWLLTHAALRRLPRAVALGLGGAYALSWATQSLAMFDFHEVALALPLLALACTAYLDGRPWLVVGWSLPLMGVKEDSVFLLLGLALALAVRRAWIASCVLAASAVASFAVVIAVLVPHYSWYGTWTYWAATATGRGHAVDGPLQVLGQAALSGKAPLLLVMLLLPTLGLALRSPLALAAIPPLLSRLTSPNEVYWGLDFHYNGTVAVVLAFAALDGLVRTGWARRLATRGPSTTAVALLLPALVILPAFPLARTVVAAAQPCPKCAAINTLQTGLQNVHVSIAADDDALAYLGGKESLHEFKPGLTDSTGARIYPYYVVLACQPGQSYLTGPRAELMHSLRFYYRQYFDATYVDEHGRDLCAWSVWTARGVASEQ